MDNAIAEIETRVAFDFDKMLLEQALLAETPDALAVLVRMADQVGASHTADLLEQRRRQLERPSLPAGSVLTKRGVVVQGGGGRAIRQLAQAGYTWRHVRLASGANVQVWNLPDYESPAVGAVPTQWSSCSGGVR